MENANSEPLNASMTPASWSEANSAQSRWLLASDDSGILFGMDWIALVGGAPQRLARKHIRLYRASLHTAFNAQSTVVGLASSPVALPARGIAYSAAALFAETCPDETALCMLILHHGECWVVAAHQGQVLVQTDRWFDDVEQARQTIEAIEQRFPHLHLYSHHLGEQDLMPAWATAPFSQRARLNRTRPILGRSKQMILSLACILGAAIYFGMPHVQQQEASRRAESDAKAHLIQRWQDTISNHPVHGQNELFKLISTWNQVPVFPGGWRLQRIDCQPQSSSWQCVAAFQRHHVLANASSLAQSLPQGWKPSFIPLDQANVTFSSEGGALRLEPSRKTSSLIWLSRLQKIRPAFDHIQVGPPVAMFYFDALSPLPEEAEPIQAIASSWQKRSLQIRGPLRSVPLLQSWDMPGWWRQVTLELRDGEYAVPGQSRFMLTLNGEMYERNE